MALWLSLTFDTGGEFPKQADSGPASLQTMADDGFRSPVERPVGRPGGLAGAISMRSNTSPPVSLLVKRLAVAGTIRSDANHSYPRYRSRPSLSDLPLIMSPNTVALR